MGGGEKDRGRPIPGLLSLVVSSRRNWFEAKVLSLEPKAKALDVFVSYIDVVSRKLSNITEFGIAEFSSNPVCRRTPLNPTLERWRLKEGGSRFSLGT